MRKVFYTYWAIYLFLMSINHIGLVLPLWTANVYKAAMLANFLYLPIHTLLKVLDRTDEMFPSISKIDTVYLEAIVVCFLLRGVLYFLSIWGLDNRWDVIAAFGILQLGYYILDVKSKIRKMEKYIY